MATLDAAGVTALNDASRALIGGLWQTQVNEGGQGTGNLARYTNDLTTIQTELTAAQAAGMAPAAATAILNDITTALNAANATINGVAGTNFATVADAQAALRTAHLDILTQVANDPALNQLGVTAIAAALPAGTTPANAPHATFAEIGVIFNDLVNHSIGGFSAATAPAAIQEVNTIQNDLKQLMAADPANFQGLTGVHAQTILNQLQLEKQYINQAATSPFAARGTNDNLNDIIDIVQGDANLTNLATFQGVTGWSATPAAANPTPKYMDNAAQTNFWADFIAQSNSLGLAAENLVGSGNKAAINTVIQDLQTFLKNTQNFDAAQGGIFEARFDNELLGNKSTTGAEVAAIIQGLQTGNSALVMAGAQQMHANATDVSGNNVALGGGAYNGDALTLAQALSTITNPAAAGPDLNPLAPALPADILALINGGAAAAGAANGMAAVGAAATGAANGMAAAGAPASGMAAPAATGAAHGMAAAGASTDLMHAGATPTADAHASAPAVDTGAMAMQMALLNAYMHHWI
jgi:hypothetical protein